MPDDAVSEAAMRNDTNDTTQASGSDAARRSHAAWTSSPAIPN